MLHKEKTKSRKYRNACHSFALYVLYIPTVVEIFFEWMFSFLRALSFYSGFSSIFLYLLSIIILDIYSDECSELCMNTIVHNSLFFQLSISQTMNSHFIARLFSHSAGPEGAVHPRRGSRRRRARIASAFLGDGGACQGRWWDGMERDGEVKSYRFNFSYSEAAAFTRNDCVF